MNCIRFRNSIGGNFMTNSRRESTKKLVLGAVLTALVIVLQLLGAFIRFGPFSISLVLVPIVIGAALCDSDI
jgi:thiamine transporter ThiT